MLNTQFRGSLGRHKYCRICDSRSIFTLKKFATCFRWNKKIQKQWQIRLILLLFKKSDNKDCNNYSGITLLIKSVHLALIDT